MVGEGDRLVSVVVEEGDDVTAPDDERGRCAGVDEDDGDFWDLGDGWNLTLRSDTSTVPSLSLSASWFLRSP